MKPLTLKLRGAIGIRDGLQTDHLEIDFTRFSPGLVCLVGPNGSGKTTIMDNLHPFLELPSRDGSLANHFYLRDSARELVFELNGRTYRSLILMDSQTGKTEAYLYSDGSPLNDGCVTTYRTQIEKLMGSPELFFKSIFAAQGAAGITALSPAKRKELFFELLGLQAYDQYVQYTGRKIEALEIVLAGAGSIAERNKKELEHRGALEADLADHKTRLASVRSLFDKLEHELQDKESYLREMQRLAEEQNRIKKEQADLVSEISSLEKKLSQTERTHDVDVEALRKKQAEVHKEIARLTKIVEHGDTIFEEVLELRDLRICEKEFARLEKESIAQQRLETERVLKTQQQLNERTVQLGQLQQKENELVANEQRLKFTVQTELADVTRRLSEARGVSSPVSEVPCREVEDLYTRCNLLVHARKALEEIPRLEQKERFLNSEDYYDNIGGGEVAAKLNALHEAKKKLMNLGAEDSASDEAGRSVPSVDYDKTIHDDIKKAINNLEAANWEQLAVELKVAESVIEEKNKAFDSLAAQIVDKEKNDEILLSDLRCQISEKRAKCLLPGVLKDYIALERAGRRELEQAQRSREQLHKDEIDLHTQIGIVEASLSQCDKLQEELAQLEESMKTDRQTIVHWRLLQRACSKDGIPALELDAAGPAVSRIANELLASSFGVRFQIAFETTKLSKDGKKQLETFAIRIMSDAGEKNIEDLSGGERVWIERSISEAIAIYLSQQSGREYLTTFQDESDGALDPDNKQNYLRMLQESFRLGRRHFTFVITQSPEIWQQVEQRVHLSPNSALELIY